MPTLGAMQFATVKELLVKATRKVREAEFEVCQALIGVDLTIFTDDEIAYLEAQADLAMRFSYNPPGFNAFVNERWRRERVKKEAKEAAELAALESQVEETGAL